MFQTSCSYILDNCIKVRIFTNWFFSHMFVSESFQNPRRMGANSLDRILYCLHCSLIDGRLRGIQAGTLVWLAIAVDLKIFAVLHKALIDACLVIAEKAMLKMRVQGFDCAPRREVRHLASACGKNVVHMGEAHLVDCVHYAGFKVV